MGALPRRHGQRPPRAHRGLGQRPVRRDARARGPPPLPQPVRHHAGGRLRGWQDHVPGAAPGKLGKWAMGQDTWGPEGIRDTWMLVFEEVETPPISRVDAIKVIDGTPMECRQHNGATTALSYPPPRPGRALGCCKDQQDGTATTMHPTMHPTIAGYCAGSTSIRRKLFGFAPPSLCPSLTTSAACASKALDYNCFWKSGAFSRSSIRGSFVYRSSLVFLARSLPAPLARSPTPHTRTHAHESRICWEYRTLASCHIYLGLSA